MDLNVDLTSLRYFVHVALSESFARGARRAHVSPPAISKAIRKLEAELGVRLFERTTRRVALTQEGQVALERARRILGDVDELARDLSQAAGRIAGPLRIAAMEVFSIELLPSALAQLVASHPEVVPLCCEMIPQRMVEHLLAGELDVGFTIGASQLPGVELHRLGVSPGVLVCGRNHPRYASGRIAAKGLERESWVVPRFFGAEHLPSLDQFPEDRFPRKVGATIELLQMGVELVALGNYLGFFPEISIRTPLANGRLRALRGLAHGTRFELCALTRTGSSIKPAAAALIEHVGRKIAEGRRHKRT